LRKNINYEPITSVMAIDISITSPKFPHLHYYISMCMLRTLRIKSALLENF
jgi:hypothetical protein